MSKSEGLKESPKKLDSEQNPEQMINEILRKYTAALLQVTKLRVDVAELQVDSELMTSTGTLLEIEIERKKAELGPESINTDGMDTL